MRDVSLITGDPVKAGLGLVSLCYDLVLMAQHFVVYAPARVNGKVHAPPRRKVGNRLCHVLGLGFKFQGP